MGKTYDNNEIPHKGHVHDLLPAYIEMSLEEAERVSVRAHLEECVDCRADYIELQATRRMLQQMPVAAVPRAFTLTPEMVKGSRKNSLLERIFAPRTAPTFASGAVVAFGLLLFLFISSTLATNPSTSTPSVASITSEAPADIMRSAATSESSTESANIMEEPTAMADAGESQAPAGGSVSKQSPTQPSDTALAPPLPAGTPVPDGMGGAVQVQPTPLVTPNTDIASSDTSSPTTTFYNISPAPDQPTTNTAAGTNAGTNNTQDTDGTVEPLATHAPIAQTFDLFLAVEIGLLVLGLALAGAYLIARRS